MIRSLFAKLAVMGGLMLLLLVPLGMIEGLLNERQGEREAAVRGVQESFAGPQRIAGPVLRIPYQVRTVVKDKVKDQEFVKVTVEEGGVSREKVVTKDVWKEESRVVLTDHHLTLLPEALRIDGKVATTMLYRSLYEVLTYAVDCNLSGHFTVDVGALAGDANVTFGTPFLAIGVGDVRGFRSSPRVQWQGRAVAVQPSNPYKLLGNGMHAPLPTFQPRTRGDYGFTVQLALAGMDGVEFSPVAKDTRVTLTSTWPHPSFFGRLLPTRREVGPDGFRAEWQTTSFANDLATALQEGDKGDAFDFGVRFLQPGDAYQLTDRVTKYAQLFVLLTFAAFFLFELLRRLRIHPMQYLLVGAALAVFYLLVLALSEHLDFAWAYLVASAACVGLIGYYAAHVLRHWRRGAGFGAMLAGLYGVLFGILQSEDNALLLGAALVFGALAAVMVLTRRLDWYGLGRTEQGAPAGP